jgi:type IV pilus assembly protein PilO
MNKIYSSIEILDNRIQQEKNLSNDIIKTFSHLQFKKIAKNKLTPIVELFNQKAMDSKVSLVSINTSSEVEEEEYVKIPFEIELRGEYHQIAKFINSVENSSYPVRIEQLDVSTKDYISYNLNASLKATLYLVRE